MRRSWLIFGALVAFGLGATPALSDPHDLYETNCGGCHTLHAGAYIRAQSSDKFRQLSGADVLTVVREKLESGHGNLTTEEIEALVGLFSQIIGNDGIYWTKCGMCHDRARLFARTSLSEVDGQIVGRKSGRSIEAFLTNHGRLTPDERSRVIDMLSTFLETQ